MFKLKNILCVVLAFVMLLTFTACGGEKPDSDPSNVGAVTDPTGGSSSTTKPTGSGDTGDGSPVEDTVPAATPISGSCGDDLTYKLDANGVLTISGTGSMTTFDYDDGEVDSPWFEQREAIVKVVMEEGITGISSHAFYKCKNLKEATIPNGPYKLGTCVFAYCESLESVEIPESYTTISRLAFQGCTSLKEVKLPSNIDYINQSSFAGCTSLKNIEIPDNVKYIITSAFSSCNALETVKLPVNLKEIGEYAFSRCKSLKEVIIPEGTQKIEGKAFFGCAALEKITIPASVTSIGNGVFEECENVTIVAPAGSTAYNYASANGLKVIAG